MATWDDLEKMTWAQLESFNWRQIETLKGSDIEHYVGEIWPLLRSLNDEERKGVIAQFLDGSLPMLVHGEHRQVPRRHQVAMRIWDLVAPQSRSEAYAAAALLVALTSLIHEFDQDRPPPDINIRIENHFEQPRPDSGRPTSPTTQAHPSNEEQK